MKKARNDADTAASLGLALGMLMSAVNLHRQGVADIQSVYETLDEIAEHFAFDFSDQNNRVRQWERKVKQ